MFGVFYGLAGSVSNSRLTIFAPRVSYAGRGSVSIHLGVLVGAITTVWTVPGALGRVAVRKTGVTPASPFVGRRVDYIMGVPTYPVGRVAFGFSTDASSFSGEKLSGHL